MALIARVSSASTFALFVDTCFFCGYQIAPSFSSIVVVVVVFVVVAALVPLPFVFTAAIFSPFLLLVFIGLRICLSQAAALFVLPSVSSYQLLVSFSGDYFPFRKYSSYRCQWCREGSNMKLMQ
jgi:hypothetical protein